MGLCRVSAALFVGQIAHKGPQSKPARIIAWVAIAWSVGSIFTIALRGDLSRPWATMDGSSGIVSASATILAIPTNDCAQYARWIAIDSSGLLIDIVLWVLSVNLVWGLQMKLRKRIFILVAFAVRLLYVFYAFRHG